MVWGVGLLGGNRPAEAAKVFRRGIAEKALPDGNPAFHFYLAGALALAERYDEALAAARSAAGKKKTPPSVCAAARRGCCTPPSATTRRWGPTARWSTSSTPTTLGGYPRRALRGPAGAVEPLRNQRRFAPGRGVARTGARRVPRPRRRHERPRLSVGRSRQEPAAGAADDPGGGRRRARQHGLPRQPGLGLVSLEKYPQALAELQKAAADKVPSGTVFDHLGDAYLKMHDRRKAVESCARRPRRIDRRRSWTRRRRLRKSNCKLQIENCKFAIFNLQSFNQRTKTAGRPLRRSPWPLRGPRAACRSAGSRARSYSP